MTTWWNNNAKDRINDFKTWTGGFSQPSKIYVRKHIAENNYANVIDCGCGLAEDFFGFQSDQCAIDYTGLDSCKFFIDTNTEKNIKMVDAELTEDLPLADSSYDCVYSREVLEHLPDYKNTLKEFIRIAKKEVIIVFFIAPSEEEEINYWEEQDLYHNKYSLKNIEEYILSNPKVKEIKWTTVEDLGYDRAEEPAAEEPAAEEPAAEETKEEPKEENNLTPDNTIVESSETLVSKNILHIYINF